MIEEKPLQLKVKVKFEQIKTKQQRKMFADTFSKNLENVLALLKPDGMSFAVLVLEFVEEEEKDGKDGIIVGCNFKADFQVDSSGKTLSDVINMCCHVALDSIENAKEENSCECDEHKETDAEFLNNISNERKKNMGLN